MFFQDLCSKIERISKIILLSKQNILLKYNNRIVLEVFLYYMF